MSDYSYAFWSQLEEMKEDIQELMWEETQGAVDAMTEMFRFTPRWYENMEDEQERYWLVSRYRGMRREHEVDE